MTKDKGILKKNIIMLFAFIVYTILIIVANTITIDNELIQKEGVDKIMHFTQFFIFALILLALLNSFKVKHLFLIALLLGLSFSIIFELIQLGIYHRTFSYYDMIANILGLIIGIGIYKWIFYKQ